MGAKTYYYDGVGNRTYEITTPPGGSTTTNVLGYPSNNNRIVQITQGSPTIRQLTYDNAGNLLTDSAGQSYTYNKRNRLSVATVMLKACLRHDALTYGYTYNALEQLAIRTQTSPAATTHFIHDLAGNVIAETAGGGPLGATGTTREYIWLPETEIAPSMRSMASGEGQSRTTVDRKMLRMFPSKGMFSIMRTHHQLWMEKYPNIEEPRAFPLTGIENARPETKAAGASRVDVAKLPFDPFQFI